MLYNGKVVGVLDIDCKTKNGFSEAEDRVGLEKWVEVVMDAVGDNGWWGQEKAV